MKALLGILYAPRCPLCRTRLPLSGEVRICPDCAQYVRTHGARHESIWVKECDDADAPLWYQDRLRDAMIDYKFHRKQSYAVWFAEQVTDCLRAHLDEWQPDGLTYVPIGPLRWWIRGYNQSALIAQAVGRTLGLPCEPTLRRRLCSRRQSKLSGAERMLNARKAFKMRKDLNLVGRRIVLIDDIMTTGSTVTSCASLLRDAGAEAVFALSVMKTPFHRSK